MDIIRTDSDNPDFVDLVRELDADLAVRDGEEHAYYAQFNKIDMIRHAVVAYEAGAAIGCGAMKEFSPDAMEIKRMYTAGDVRGRGVATLVLAELERWAQEMNYESCVLETGLKQPEAIGLYTKSGYVRIPNYGQYIGRDNSVCFSKKLS